MKTPWLRSGLAMALALAIAGCGGGGGGSDIPTVTAPPSVSSAAVKSAVDTAAGNATNDTSVNASAPFAVLQGAGLPAVTVQSPPKVNFAVFSDGRVKSDLTLSNLSVAIAKLVPGTNGNPDQWVNYVYRTETATAGYGPNGQPVLASAQQATTDPKQTDATLAAQQLVFNPDGYYTYTFRTDIKDPTKTNGVVFEPNRTHRVAIQLAYTNAAGETVRVNPYFDFRLDANGNSVPVSESDTRKMVDMASCNSCHDKLGLHGGGRVDVQFCVMCHNPGTTDANSGNVLTLATMAHKIHAGKLLASQGVNYTIWGYNNGKHDYSEVGFPQDLRNCTKCHTGANPATPQGDNWKTKPTREACLTCHTNGPSSSWYQVHYVLNNNQDPNATATLMPNSACAGCHKPGTAIAPERVHWNQNEEDSTKYKMNIESASYDAAARKVTVKYFLSDPTNGNAAYNLVTSDCTYTGTASPCVPPTGSVTTKFGNLRIYLGYQNMVGQQAAITEYSSFNNGGGNAYAYAAAGTNDGSNHYTIQIAVPADTATAVAFGTARLVTVGQVKEAKLEAKAAVDPRPEVVPRTMISVVVQNTWTELALTGSLQPRRQIVGTDKCNACHGSLGTTSGSNTLSEAFHGGARTIVEACVVCHDANKVSSTVMTNGLALNESYQFKRMIHGIHGNKDRTYPFTHGNSVQGIFNMDGVLQSGGSFLADYKLTINNTSTLIVPAGTQVATGSTFDTIAGIINQVAATKGYTGTPVAAAENYGAEVAWPGPEGKMNCNACHVNNSYKQDMGTVAAVVRKPAGVTDPNQWMVISPKAASCTACHDSPAALGHVTSFGGATFGDRTQAQVQALPRETCNDCHSPGVFKGVDIVHGQK